MIIQQYDLFNFIDNGETNGESITIIKARKKHKPRPAPPRRRVELDGQVKLYLESYDRKKNI